MELKATKSNDNDNDNVNCNGNNNEDDYKVRDNDDSDKEINICSEELQIVDILCTTKSGRTVVRHGKRGICTAN